MTPRRAAVLSVGDELVLGSALDTNGREVAAALRDAGLDCAEHRTVGDDMPALVAALRELAAAHAVLVVTGGLGPTEDDLTREAVNALSDAGAPMTEDAQGRADLERWFAGRGRAMAPNNLRQALRPRSARTLRNANGTAPGFACAIGACTVFCLPGPPREMLPMLHEQVVPAVRAPGAPAIVRASVGTFGIGESDLAHRLGNLMERGREPGIGTTASGSVVSIHATARGADAAARAQAALAECAQRVVPYAFGPPEAGIAAASLESLRAAGATLAVAESCTGGLVGSMLTAVAGASDCFLGGWISYANAMKERELGVPAATLATAGAVSRETALAMAQGAAARAGATHALAITGIAGPGGATEGKPVGTVWIALHDARTGAGRARRFEFPGPREVVRDRASKAALQMLRWHLRGEDAPIIWERA
ncbi:MAG: CinA family nicotinamide mononucleotide deamidase-related protein [Phycisphaerales bacterium]